MALSGEIMQHMKIVVLTLLSACLAFAQAPQTAPTPATEKKPAPLVGLDVSLLDKSADPCGDFFQYACGTWLKNNPIPPDRSAWGRDSELAERNQFILRSILETAAASKAGRSATDQKIGDYYSSCMDEQAAEKAGIAPLQPELDRIAAMKDKSELAGAFARLHSMGVGVGFGFGSAQDMKDATSVIAEADQGGLGLPERDYYFRDDAKSKELRAQYVQHVTNMLKLAGETESQAAADAAAILELETALAKASMDVVSRRDPNKLYHKMTMAEFDALAPKFNWVAFRTGIQLPAVSSINVVVPEFMKAFNELIETRDLSLWKTYLKWHTISNAAPYLSSAFVNEDFDFFSRKLVGAEQLRPRWKRCVSYVDRDLGEALGQAYVDVAFPPSSKERTLKIVRDIEAAMARDIQALDWMSDATKKRAMEKLHTVANKIGYPDKWRDYTALEIRAGDLLGNVLRSQEFESRRELAKIGKPIDRGEWLMTPSTVNAYYNPQMNDINFPAGILQPPYFDPKADDAVNYGDIGATIGHELTHGFDDEGRQFDADGNLKEWWTESDGKKFEERAECVVKEFSEFTAVDDVKLDGKLTLGENVADLGGLLLAYMAYTTSTGGKVPPPVDGFTADQRFFIAYAQGWCENDRPELLRLMAQTNPHSPAVWRVNGIVSNMPEFQKAFGCKAGQAMVRQPMCKVW